MAKGIQNCHSNYAAGQRRNNNAAHFLSATCSSASRFLTNIALGLLAIIHREHSLQIKDRMS
jgi:hypothetical protein